MRLPLMSATGACLSAVTMFGCIPARILDDLFV